MEDKYAIAVVGHRLTGDKVAHTVRHLPHELSQVLWYFLLHKGEVHCEVTGRRQCSPLVQGGLKIPRCVTLYAKKKMVAKAHILLEKDQTAFYQCNHYSNL